MASINKALLNQNRGLFLTGNEALFLLFAVIMLFSGCSRSVENQTDKSLSPVESYKQKTAKRRDDTWDPPFAKQKTVTFKELRNEIERWSKILSDNERMKERFRNFAQKHNLKVTETTYPHYVKSIVLFESTVQDGLWHIQWRGLDIEENSSDIWRQWRNLDSVNLYSKYSASGGSLETASLYAFLCKASGINNVGIFQYSQNNTGAVWKLNSKEDGEVRIVIPLSQVLFLRTAIFDDDRINPWTQETIQNYQGVDVSESYPIPAPLADFFINQIRKYALASEDTLLYLRSLRYQLLNGTIPREIAFDEISSIISRMILDNADIEDISALEHFARNYISGFVK